MDSDHGGLRTQKRFFGEGSNAQERYRLWKKWVNAHLRFQKSKSVEPEAYGALVRTLLDGTALKAVESLEIENLATAGCEDLIFEL